MQNIQEVFSKIREMKKEQKVAVDSQEEEYTGMHP